MTRRNRLPRQTMVHGTTEWPPVLERLLARSTRTPTGCLVVRGADPYARVRHAGKTWYVHRLAYTLLVEPIPDELTIDHLCDTKACWDVTHLEPVTRGENARRGTHAALLA